MDVQYLLQIIAIFLCSVDTRGIPFFYEQNAMYHFFTHFPWHARNRISGNCALFGKKLH